MTRPRPAGEEALQDIQVMLKSDASPSSIRSLKVGLLRGGLEGGSGCCVVWASEAGGLGASCVSLSRTSPMDRCLLRSCGQASSQVLEK